MIDHSQPPAVKTHRTDKTDPEKTEDSVSIVNQSASIDSPKKGKVKQSDMPPEQIYKKKQDDIVMLIQSNMKKSEAIESTLASRPIASNYNTSQG